jgi:hypothetical protein
MGGSQRDELLVNLSDVLLDVKSSERQRQNAKRALARMCDDATLAYLARAALETDSTQAALDVLDLLAGRRSLGNLELALVGFMYDASPEVRRKAMEVIGSKGSPRMAGSLQQVVDAASQDKTMLEPEDAALAQTSLEHIRARS